MPGKQKCKLLREIRRKIADENDIPLATEECRYQGDCRGTCPRCESELRYLEQQLEKRRSIGKRVTVSALALGMAATLGGCIPQPLEGDVPYTPPETETVAGVDGGAATPTDGPEDFTLEGDVLYVPDSGFAPEDNIMATVYGPPETVAPPAAFDPGDNVEANIYGPPEMMESFNSNG